MMIPTLLVAVLLLLLGQRLYWLFVGGIGFIAGLDFAARLLAGQPEWELLAAALLAGLAGAVLAIFFQRLAVCAAGFLAGGYLAGAVVQEIGSAGLGGPHEVWWLIYVIGGVIGAILAVALLDWALIIISAAVGAALLAPWAVHERSWRGLLFLGLWVVGVMVQAGLRRGRRHRLREDS